MKLSARNAAVIGLMLLAPLGFWIVESKLIRGEVQLKQTLKAEGPLRLPVTQAGVEHTVELYTKDARQLTFTVRDPDGTAVVTEAEPEETRGARSTRFTPDQPGEWTLEVTPLPVTVTLLTNDNRKLGCGS